MVVGALFISATVASIVGSAALGSVLEAPDYLVTLAGHESRVVVAVLLFLVAASSAVATAFLLLPILRPHAEGLATGYVVLRTFENVFYGAGAVALLMMLTVSQSDAIATVAPSQLSVLGVSLLAMHDWSVAIGTLLFFGLGAWTLNYVLYRSVLVPRWLALWGLIGAVMVFAYGVLGILGYDTSMGSPYMLLAMPIALQEMVFAVWIISKGFDRPEVPLDHVREIRVDVMT
jgi:hypothetical protein